MTTGMKKALIVYLSVLLMILFAGFAGADQTKAEIEAENPYMTEAINEALDGIRNGHGGPFGCVIVKDGEVVYEKWDHGYGPGALSKRGNSYEHVSLFACNCKRRGGILIVGFR